MEQKVAKVFPQNYQIKRVLNQIQDIKALRQKGHHDIVMALIKSQCIVFRIKLLSGALKNMKNVPSSAVIIKIVIRKDYPVRSPKLYFMHQEMVTLNFLPFRDYFGQLLTFTNQPWSPKISLMQIIKNIPQFIDNSIKKGQIQNTIPPITLQQYFQIDSICSWKYCQVHPIRFYQNKTYIEGFMVVNQTVRQIIFLKNIGLQASLLTCDYFKHDQIMTLRKNKKNHTHLLLQVKFKVDTNLKNNQMKGRYCIEFFSQDFDTILVSIMQLIKLDDSTKNQQVYDDQTSEDQSSIAQQQSQKTQSINISEILESIVVYQSLVDNQMTSQNINQLVLLLKRAIQYYSAQSDPRFKVYLQKMQLILSNQMAQALLQSTDDNQNKVSANNFKSIVDLI